MKDTKTLPMLVKTGKTATKRHKITTYPKLAQKDIRKSSQRCKTQ